MRESLFHARRRQSRQPETGCTVRLSARPGACAGNFLSGFSDGLHTDGYEAYHCKLSPEITVLGYCAYIRRKFTGLQAGGDLCADAQIPDEMFSRGDHGCPLLTMDLERIRAANHSATVMMALTNGDGFSSVEEVGSGEIQPRERRAANR